MEKTIEKLSRRGRPPTVTFNGDKATVKIRKQAVTFDTSHGAALTSRDLTLPQSEIEYARSLVLRAAGAR